MPSIEDGLSLPRQSLRAVFLSPEAAQDWRSLQLDIQSDSVYTVEDAPGHISQPRQPQAGKKMQVETLPSVVVLQFKRFLYDAAADRMIKIGKPVQFAPELEIPLVMAPVVEKSAEPADYKLYGVLYHHGESAAGRHYTVDVLHRNEGSDSGEAWLHIDDEAVSMVRHEEVFRGHDNERVDDRCAYMLFYSRTAPT